MLDKELWKKLPMTQGSIPELAAALQGSQGTSLGKTGSTGSLSASTAQNGLGSAATSDTFDVWMVQGNPWRSTQGKTACTVAVLRVEGESPDSSLDVGEPLS